MSDLSASPDSHGTVKILLVSGSLRAGSVNTAVLRTAASLADGDVRATLYEGLGELPHFNPDDDPEGGPVHPAVADLRRRLADADAVLLCTPEYAGALPGSFKNLLDWTVGGGETYGKPVAWSMPPAAPSLAVRAARMSRCAQSSATRASISSRRRAGGSPFREAPSASTASSATRPSAHRSSRR